MFFKIRILLFVTIIFSFMSNAFAEEFYYRSDKYHCEGKRSNDAYLMWARFIPQGDTIDVMFVWNPEPDEGYRKFQIKKSDLKSSMTVKIDNSRSYQIDNLNNLGGNKPLIVNRKWDSSCAKTTTLNPVKKGIKEVYQDEIDTLNKRPITSNQYLLASKKWWQSPPTFWLPELDQKTMEASRDKAWDNFYKDYPTAMLNQFQQTTISEQDAERIINDVLITHKRTGNRRFRKELQGPVENMVLYWAVLNRNTPEKARKFAVKDADELCTMTSRIPVRNQADLRWITKLPQPLWSREYAEKVLQWAKSCKNYSDRIIRVVKNEWADIEKMVQSYPQFVEVLNRKLSQSANIEELKAQGWNSKFTDSERESFYISEDVVEVAEESLIKPYLFSLIPSLEKMFTDNLLTITDINKYPNYCQDTTEIIRTYEGSFAEAAYNACEKAKATQYTKKIAEAAEQWANAGKQQLNDKKITISQLGHFCSQQTDNINYRDLRNKLVEQCNELLVTEVTSTGKEILADVKQQLQSIPQNFEGVKKITQLNKQLEIESSYSYSDAFQNAFAELEKTYEPTVEQIKSMYKNIDTTMTNALSKEYQSIIDDEDDIDTVNAKMQEIQQKSDQLHQEDYEVRNFLSGYSDLINK